MNELAAQRSRIDKITDAAQSIQERIVCGICLELFNEPVTIKCGHRFCRSCILRVTNNENSACPFCNIKIRKRSIPTEGNKIFQLFMKHFLTLIQAIKEDSGIDVLESYSKTKNTKESVPLDEKPSTNVSKGSSSQTNRKSTNSKIKSQSSKINSLPKKKVNQNFSNRKYTLHKYLSNNSDNVPDRELHSKEKVKSWLNNISSHIDDADTLDSNNEDGSTFLKKVNEQFKVPEILVSPQFVESIESPGFNNQPSTSKIKEPELDGSVTTKDEELKYKETQSRIQELEMIARRKKLNLLDKSVLKTPNSVPAATHSDAYDWRRVKKIGKEMQAKTFKTLNISVEKNSSSVAVDDNVPSTSSMINENKNRRKLLKEHENSLQRETPKTNNSSMDTTGSHKGENVSLSCIGQEQVNEIIEISSAQDDLCISETGNTSSVLNNECTSNLKHSNPLIRPAVKNYENDTDDNFQNSPSIHKLSLKRNLINSDNTKLISSQSGTPGKTNPSENNSPRKFSPERPKSRLSLRVPLVKISDQSEKQSKSAVLNHNDAQSTITNNNFHKQNSDNGRNSTSSRGSRISFKKLGKICKKRKNVPFIQLGKIRPKIISNADNQKTSSILVKSNVPVNFEFNSVMVSSKPSKVKSDMSDNKEMKILAPEEDSQLKYLAIESLHRPGGVIDMTENVNKSVFWTTYQDQVHALVEDDSVPSIDSESNILMEVDATSSVHHVEKHKSDLQKENNFLINEKVHVQNENASDCEEISKHCNKKNVKDNLKSDLVKASTSKNHSKVEKPLRTINTSSTDNERCEDDKESDYSESNQISSPAKTKLTENENEDQDVVSFNLKESDKLTSNLNAQNKVENGKVKLTEILHTTEVKRNIISEAESNAGSEIRHKPIKKSSISSSTLSTVKETNKYSEVESNADSDESDAKIQSNSRKTSFNSASTFNCVRERNKLSEAESNADSDIPKIRRRSSNRSSSSSSTLSSVKERNKVSEAKSNADLRDLKMRRKSKKATSSTGSTLSSIKKTSKKKRTRSDSSNDDEDLDVTSIIGKWCGNADVPVSKKAKLVSSTHNNLITNQDMPKLILTEDDNDDDVDVTLGADENQMESRALQRDPPIDDIISKVKSLKEIELNSSKLVAIPSSLMSAELFESNEPCMQPSAQISPKQINSDQVIDDKSQVIDTTLVDLVQTIRKKSNMSESSDGSNKENNISNNINPSPVNVGEGSGDRINEIELNSHNEKSRITKNLNSQTDAYQISESLMNITQEQLALKRIEKDLIGIDLSTIHDNKNKVVEDSDKYSTPQGTKKPTRNIDAVNKDEMNEDDDFDPDSIGATPCAKKSKKSIRDANQLLSKFSAGSQINSSEIFSPGKDMVDLIPAVTPVKNRKSYPLCHSTPVINAPNSKSQLVQPKMVLICSGLQTEQIKKVQTFAKRFNCKFQAAFTMDVTHVIILTDAETKIGQRTFKYIQGIAFQKHVLSFQWILDCLDKNVLQDEEDEKYEVLDGDVFESGAKKSRNRQQGLFESFAFFCLEPFTALLITEFKDILSFNGAVVVDSVAQLAAQKNKYRIIILPEDFDLNQKILNVFKKAQCALVSFDWIVDSISQYHTISIVPYLQETAPEELLALGFPAEYLVEEEFGEEDEENELE